jgi:hypothetical protein
MNNDLIQNLKVVSTIVNEVLVKEIAQTKNLIHVASLEMNPHLRSEQLEMLKEKRLAEGYLDPESNDQIYEMNIEALIEAKDGPALKMKLHRFEEDYGNRPETLYKLARLNNAAGNKVEARRLFIEAEKLNREWTGRSLLRSGYLKNQESI